VGISTAALTGLLTGCQATPTSTTITSSNELQTASPAAVVASAPVPAASPLVKTPATNAAEEIQNAFEQVAKAADPAVVTITTLQRVPNRQSMGGPGFDPFGGGMDQGGGDQDLLNQLLRQFQQRFGHGGNGGPGGSSNDSDDNSDLAQPQAFSLPSPDPDGPLDPANIYRVQSVPGRRGGAARGPLVGTGLGSGFIYRADGLILTNAHVVAGADRVTVKLSDGREFRDARVLGQDTRTDVAVVKIPADNLPTLPTGESNNVQVGDWAIAVGNPYGLDRTLTVGVISAKNRQVPLSDSGPGTYLQTDASINPGNSGGPLLDINGRVIGLNDAIYSQTGSSIGIGFAIPIDTARQIADTLVSKGRIQRAYLGVAITDVTDQATAFGLPSGTKGALVESVSPGSPAARAGLQPGDVITAIGDQTVTTSTDLQQRITGSPIGSTATFTVLRSGQTRTISAHLEELKDTAGQKSGNNGGDNSDESQPTQLGVRLAPLTPDIASQLGVPSGTAGVVVAGVVSGSPAQIAGLRTGDVIERVGQTAVRTPAAVKAEVSAILSRQPADQKSVALYINRGGKRQYVVVSL